VDRTPQHEIYLSSRVPTTQVTLKVIDRESGFYELKKIKFTNSSEFYKRQLNFILKFGPLILTEKLQSLFFAVTETLNSDNCMTSLPLWVKQACAKSENLPTQKKLSHLHLNNVVLNFYWLGSRVVSVLD